MGNNLNYMRRRMQLGAQPHKAKASGAVATFRTNLAARLDSLFVDVTPVQDLHGQANPYPPGGGKNLFQTTMESSTQHEVVFTVNSDGSVTAKNTPDANTTKIFGLVTLPAGTYKVNGFANGASNDIRMGVYNETLSSTIASVYGGRDIEFTLASESVVRLYAICPTTWDGAQVTFYPMVRLASVTDATFAPYSNICPITGWAAANVTGTGKNLFDPDSTSKEWVDTSNVLEYRNGAKSNRVVCSEGMSFTLSQKNASSSRNVMLISFLDKNDNVLSRKVKANGDTVLTDTAPAGAVVCLASFLAWTDTDEQQLESGSTASAYTPYVGTTAVVQFGQTVYGARIDWKGRKAVCTHAYMDLGDMDRSWDISGAPNVSNAAIKNLVDIPANNNVVVDMICSHYQTKSRNKLNSADVTTGCCVNYGGIFLVKDPACNGMTREQVKTYLTGVTIAYPLATPVEIPLDLVDFVTEPGINNVFADCGNTDLSYWTNV